MQIGDLEDINKRVIETETDRKTERKKKVNGNKCIKSDKHMIVTSSFFNYYYYYSHRELSKNSFDLAANGFLNLSQISVAVKAICIVFFALTHSSNDTDEK